MASINRDFAIEFFQLNNLTHIKSIEITTKHELLYDYSNSSNNSSYKYKDNTPTYYLLNSKKRLDNSLNYRDLSDLDKKLFREQILLKLKQSIIKDGYIEGDVLISLVRSEEENSLTHAVRKTPISFINLSEEEYDFLKSYNNPSKKFIKEYSTTVANSIERNYKRDQDKYMLYQYLKIEIDNLQERIVNPKQIDL
jgi:hypothetical protein